MEILIKILQFILSFSLLVFIHEFGHFIFARMFGVRVEKFYLFFNPWFSLFKFNWKGTEWGMGWIPLGGYCKISGMVDESMDVEQMKLPAKDDEFRAKKPWQRLLIMIGGVMMNVILAIFIYIGMSYAWGDKYLANDDVRYGYVFNETGKKLGFENGDKIYSIAGKRVDNIADIHKNILLEGETEVIVLRHDHTGHASDCAGVELDPVAINIDGSLTKELIQQKKPFLEPRSLFEIQDIVENGNAAVAGILKDDRLTHINGNQVRYADEAKAIFNENKGGSVTIRTLRIYGVETPSMQDVEVKVSDEGTIGVILTPFISTMPIHTQKYTFFQAIPAGIKRTGSEISSYWKQIKMIFSPKTEAYKSLGGMIAIGNIFPSYWSWETFWSITAFLSIILAVMNILPIPALDGGHVLFLIAEIIMGRAPSDKFLEYAQRVGMILLFALLIYANGNDIYRFIIK
ncbi:MAG: RIP metalloprotease RseP [Rikenellaceae bacterium]